MAVPSEMLNDPMVTSEDRIRMEVCQRFRYDDFFSDWPKFTASQKEQLLGNIRAVDWDWIAKFFPFRDKNDSKTWEGYDSHPLFTLHAPANWEGKKYKMGDKLETLQQGTVLAYTVGGVMGKILDISTGSINVRFEPVSEEEKNLATERTAALEIRQADCYMVDGPSMGPSEDYAAFEIPAGRIVLLGAVNHPQAAAGLLQILDRRSSYWQRVSQVLASMGGTCFWADRVYIVALHAYLVLVASGFPRAIADMFWWCSCQNGDFATLQKNRCQEALAKLSVDYPFANCTLDESMREAVTKVDKPLYANLLRHRVAEYPSQSIFEFLAGKSEECRIIALRNMLLENRFGRFYDKLDPERAAAISETLSLFN